MHARARGEAGAAGARRNAMGLEGSVRRASAAAQASGPGKRRKAEQASGGREEAAAAAAEAALLDGFPAGRVLDDRTALP